MGQYPYGTSGLCPHTGSPHTEGTNAVTTLHNDPSIGTTPTEAAVGVILLGIVIGGPELIPLITELMPCTCADGDCTNEVRGVQQTIDFLPNQLNRINHIMQVGHAWNRLIPLSGNAAQDYQAIQPYLQQVMLTPGTQIGMSRLGPIMEFVDTVNGEQVVVRAIQLANGTLQITDAWVRTR